nr:hypothetical protein [uncultured Flavobacterium sp.]
MKKILIVIVSIALFISCSNDNNNDEDASQKENSSELKIRLSNASKLDFQNIKVNTSTGNVNYGNLKAGKKSDYKVFEMAYRYAFIELQIDGKTYTLQPIDYVGEKPLENGNYTFQINANDSKDQYQKLSLTLIED